MASYIASNQYLTERQKQYNAQFIKGWCDANWPMNLVAFCGILGNADQESTLNPGLWQNRAEGVGPGYGLLQWTPQSKLTYWTRPRGYPDWDMVGQLLWTRDNTVPYGQWRKTASYPFSFQEYFEKEEHGTDWNVVRAAECWCLNWEQGGYSELPIRRKNAVKWYAYFGGENPPEIIEPDPSWPTHPDNPYTSMKMPLWFYLKHHTPQNRRKQ